MTIMLAVNFTYKYLFPTSMSSSYPLDEGTWSLISVLPGDLDVIIDDDTILFTADDEGEFTVVIENENGEQQTFDIYIREDEFNVQEKKD